MMMPPTTQPTEDDSSCISSDNLDNSTLEMINFGKPEIKKGENTPVNMARGVTWRPLGIHCQFKNCNFEAYQYCNSDLCCIWKGCGKAVCLHHVVIEEQPCCTCSENNQTSSFEAQEPQKYVWYCKDEKCKTGFDKACKRILVFSCCLMFAYVLYQILK